ncbi:MAG: Maf family protein [Candidatus Cloacimonadales bacterium]
MIHKILQDKQIVLASASPRRKLLLQQIGLNALQMPANIPETHDSTTPRILVKNLAAAKALAVAKKVDDDCLIIAADTVVYFEKEIMEKPLSARQAAEFLARLSDKSHYVYTGIAIYYRHTLISDFSKSRVTFKQLSAREIADYIATGEPMDKAGAYGIQGYGSQFVSKISGCYFNVMGFPVQLFYEMLKKMFLTQN